MGSTKARIAKSGKQSPKKKSSSKGQSHSKKRARVSSNKKSSKKKPSKRSSRKKTERKSDEPEGLLALYIKIRQWFQPYYRWYPKSDKHDPKAIAREQRRRAKAAKRGKPTGKSLHEEDTLVPSVKILNYPKPLHNGMKFQKKPKPGSIWCYHNDRHHQIFAHFEPGMGYVHRERDHKARKSLKPLVYPNQGRPFDRTHTIPIGYHGSENDNRLLIGWDSDVNRGAFNEFEKKQKARKEPIYWMTLVDKIPGGARWRYLIYDARNDALLDSLESTMKCDFVWKD